MAYLTVYTAFNLLAQGLTPSGEKADNSYELDCIKNNVRIKFNQAIYATYNGSTKYTFIPANTYVNLVKNPLRPHQYVYSARTTQNVSSYSFPNITTNYSLNIPDIINNPTATGTTIAGTGITATILLSATTTGSIPYPVRANTITLSSAHTRCCTFTLNTAQSNISGYKIMELRHMDLNSGGTYLYGDELYSLVGESTRSIQYYTPYSGNTFMINRMTNDVTSVVCTFNTSTLSKSVDITGLYNTNPNGKILTSKLLTKIYPNAFNCQSVNFTYGDDTKGGLVFTYDTQYEGIQDIHDGMPDYNDGGSPSIFSGFSKQSIANGSLNYAVRCDELLGMGAAFNSVSPIGNVVHTYYAFLAINASDKTQTLQGNIGGVIKVPFVSGIDNEFTFTWSGGTSKVDSAEIHNGIIYIVVNKSNISETGYLKITAKGEDSSTASQAIKLISEEQSCSNCDNCSYCNNTSCQYT